MAAKPVRESPMTQDILTEIVPIASEIRNFRAHSRRGVTANVLERQERLLCGKHAINHILQETKVDWQPRNPDLLITGSRNPMNRHTHINLAQFCGPYFEYYLAARRFPVNARMPECDLINGNISSSVIQVFFANLLNYRVDVIGFAREKRADLRRLAGHLEEHDCLGAIINIGGEHWTAVSRYLNACRKRVGPRLEKFRWAYIDSLAASIYECTDSLGELFAKYGGRFTQAILIYNRPGESYYSVAAERMDRHVADNALAAATAIEGVYASPIIRQAPATAANNARSYAPNNNARTYAPNNNAASAVSYDPLAGAPTPVGAVRGRAPTPGRRSLKSAMKKPGAGGTRRRGRQTQRR